MHERLKIVHFRSDPRRWFIAFRVDGRNVATDFYVVWRVRRHTRTEFEIHFVDPCRGKTLTRLFVGRSAAAGFIRAERKRCRDLKTDR